MTRRQKKERLIKSFYELMKSFYAYMEWYEKKHGVKTEDEFKEALHPRDEDGKFAKTNGSKKDKEKDAKKDEPKKETTRKDNTEPTKEQQAEIENKIKELDKIDFTKETTLPNLPSFVLKRYGLKDKPILLKSKIIDKNLRSHKDITLEDTKIIFSHSLYKPEAILKANKNKPAYHNFISRVGEHKNTIVLLELSETKENFEIVNFHYLGERQKEQKSKGQ